MSVHIITGDCRDVLATLDTGSVQTCITSPPYFGLRSYLDRGDPEKVRELGAEQTVDAYVANLVAVFRGVWRVLRDDGTLWLNLGSSFQGKQELGIPWRVAFALQEDGYYLRSDIIWHKPNSMPENVRDRPTKAHEYIFLLTKQPRYFFDADAVKEAGVESKHQRSARIGGANGHTIRHSEGGMIGVSATRNIRSVWTIATHPYAGAHFAAFPPALVEPCVKAGTSEKGACSACGAPWVRVVERDLREGARRELGRGISLADSGLMPGKDNGQYDHHGDGLHLYTNRTTGWQPGCLCNESYPIPCVVLDPFAGAGTVGLVADRLGRDAVLVEVNEAYAAMARKRISGEAPMFVEVV